jgi:hypothetical protein
MELVSIIFYGIVFDLIYILYCTPTRQLIYVYINFLSSELFRFFFFCKFIPCFLFLCYLQILLNLTGLFVLCYMFCSVRCSLIICFCPVARQPEQIN